MTTKVKALDRLIDAIAGSDVPVAAQTVAGTIDALADTLAGDDVTFTAQDIAGRLDELAKMVEDGTIVIGGGDIGLPVGFQMNALAESLGEFALYCGDWVNATEQERNTMPVAFRGYAASATFQARTIYTCLIHAQVLDPTTLTITGASIAVLDSSGQPVATHSVSADDIVMDYVTNNLAIYLDFLNQYKSEVPSGGMIAVIINTSA